MKRKTGATRNCDLMREATLVEIIVAPILALGIAFAYAGLFLGLVGA